jgi:hypothetical protein
MHRIVSISLLATAIAGAQCPSANTTCTAQWNGGNGNTFALILQTGANAETVFGFDLLTRAMSAPVNTTIVLYLADPAGQPIIPPARTGPMTVIPNFQLHVGVLNSSITIPANTRYFIGFAEAGMHHPICAAAGTPTSYYWHPPNATTWNGTFQQNWSYRVTCAPGYGTYGAGCRASNQMVPVLANTGVPRLNQSFSVDLSQAPAGRPAILFFGASRTTWFNIPLPLDLTPFGAPCSVLASAEVTISTATNASGTASIPINVPNDAGLIGAGFFNQFWLIDPGNNPLNLAASNAGAGIAGQ